MQESYVEGLANHDGPESCASGREAAGEALTGALAGRPLSRVSLTPRRELRVNRSAEAVRKCRRPHRHRRQGEVVLGSARSETPHTRGNISHGNREILRSSAARWEAFAAERIVKPSGVRR
jgi:hypothetical protein